MTRRLLVVEPDPAGRMVVQRALSSAGYAVAVATTIAEARAGLDAGQVRLAIVDEAAGSGQALDEVRRLRSLYPRVPVVVTGTLLSQRLLLALLRLGVMDALPKPFSPAELVEAVEAALDRVEGDEGAEYAAALALARHAIGRGRPEEARVALQRARAVAPLDSAALALAVLVEELSGHDALASRGYRALLALTNGDGDEGSDARAGLARTERYGEAQPVEQLGAAFRGAHLWISDDDLALPDAPRPLVVAAGLGLGGEAIFLRQGPGEVAFALFAGHPRSPLLETLIDAYQLRPLPGEPQAQPSGSHLVDGAPPESPRRLVDRSAG